MTRSTAPRGRVTIAEAAEISGLSIEIVLRNIGDDIVSGKHDGSGREWTIARADVTRLDPYTSGRPDTVTPWGRVTLHNAAAKSGLSYAEVYRRCAIVKSIPSAQQDDSGVWTIQRGDLRLLTRRGPSTDKRPPPIMLRPRHERLAAWETAAKKQGCTVGELALKLMDEVSGWEG